MSIVVEPKLPDYYAQSEDNINERDMLVWNHGVNASYVDLLLLIYFIYNTRSRTENML